MLLHCYAPPNVDHLTSVWWRYTVLVLEQHAFVNREECRACKTGLVVTVPFKGTTDFCHMCANCGVKDVTNHFLRDPAGFV